MRLRKTWIQSYPVVTAILAACRPVPVIILVEGNDEIWSFFGDSYPRIDMFLRVWYGEMAAMLRVRIKAGFMDKCSWDV